VVIVKFGCFNLRSVKSYHVIPSIFLVLAGLVCAAQTTSIKIVVLGSSTAAGTGASSYSKAWVGRLDSWLDSNIASHTVTNLAMGGYSTKKIRPTGNGSPDIARNINAALSYNPDLIIVNMPSNDVAESISTANSLSNFREVIAKAREANVPVWITTTQPRNFPTQEDRDLLKIQADSIRKAFAPNVIDIYYELTDFSNGKTIKASYAYGDGIHLNDAGHLFIFNEVKKKLEPFINSNTVYYSKATGSLNTLGTWSYNPDGTGGPPVSFTFNRHDFVITRNLSTLSSEWTVNGSGSRVVVAENSTFSINGSGKINGKLEVSNNSIVNISSTSMPVFESIAPTATVTFNTYDVGETIPAITYGHLVLNGTGLKQINSSLLEIKGNLTIGNGVGIKGSAGNLTTVKISGHLQIGTPSPIVAETNLINLQFTENLTHQITVSGGQAFNKIIGNTGSIIIFDDISTATPTILSLGSANGGGLDLAKNSVLDVKNNTLMLSGKATINPSNTQGKIAIDSGTIQLTTTSNQDNNLYFDNTRNKVENFVLTSTGGGKTFIRELMAIYDGISINDGELRALGNIILKSNSTASASIREIKNNGVIVGEITLERFLPPNGRTYRYLSSSLANVKVENWQTYIPVTGNFEGANSGTSNSSLHKYNEAMGGWLPFPANGSSNQEVFEKGRGYSIFMRKTDEPTLLVTTGEPHQKDVNFSLTPGTNSSGDGWNLLGNPYACPIIWNNVGWNSSNIGNVIYVRQNNPDGTFMWRTWDRSTNHGELEDGKIPSGQAFWVHTGPSPSLTVKEIAKANDPALQNFYIYRQEKDSINSYSFLEFELVNGRDKDIAYIKFNPEGEDSFTFLTDGPKKLNSNLNLSSFSAEKIPLIVNDLSDQFSEKKIDLLITDVLPGNHALRFKEVKNFKISEIELIDHFLSKKIKISATQSTYEFTITADSLSYKKRFSLLFKKVAIVTSTNDSVDSIFTFHAFPVPSSGAITFKGTCPFSDRLSLEVMDLVGKNWFDKTISGEAFKAGVSTAENLPSGVYIARAKREGAVLYQKLLIQ
jgi:lysophospholipase L1-like esterase